MTAAAKHLASVTLELGGKCPAIVDETTDLAQAAAQVAFGKHYNSGQICLSPDHVWVKEELRAGRTLGAAMEAGVARAWPAIRDSNTSTLITCGVLYFFGAPLIKGFAITLAIGVGVSMFSAIVTTQQLLQVVAGIRPARRLGLYGVSAPRKAVAA